MLNKLEELQQDRRDLLNIIQKHGPLTKQSIQNMTNLRLTTLNRMLQDLVKTELVVEEALGESTGGRKPTLYNVNSSRYYFIGIDISRTYTQMVFTNLRLQKLISCRFSMKAKYSAEEILNKIIIEIKNMIEELKIQKEQILGIGIGTIGPVDRKKGKLLNPVSFSGKGWRQVSIKEYLEKELGLAVEIDNGANSAVLGEYFYGSGKNLENIAYINCGIGIRTGVITSGKIIRSINDREDALGHMVIDIYGKRCHCGNKGCVESYASINSILNEFNREIKKGKISSVRKDISQINCFDVFRAADEGDAVSSEVVTNSALVFGTGLANYINLLNPQLVILSGPTIYSSKLFYKISTETALRKINITSFNTKFSLGGFFKEYAIAMGAAAMIIEIYLTNKVEGR